MPAAPESEAQAAQRESTSKGFTAITGTVGGVILYATVAAVVHTYVNGLQAALVSVVVAATLAALTILAARFGHQLLEAEILHRSGTGPRDELQDQIIVRALAVTGSVALLATGVATVAVSLWDLDGDRAIPVLFALLWVCAVAAREYIRRAY